MTKPKPGQWWESPDGDRFRVIAPLITKGWWALDDGTEEPDSLHETSFKSWTYLGTSHDPDPHAALLEAEHDDRQDPEEWVVQDRVAPRKGLDEVHWSDWPGDLWVGAIVDWEKHKRHGHFSRATDSTLSVRCRRKDLPPLGESCNAVGVPQQPAKKRVRLWIPREHNSRSATFATIDDKEMNKALWQEIKHDGKGFCVED